jgi:hypothetical protein
MGPTTINFYRLRPYLTTLAFRHSRTQSFQKEKRTAALTHTSADLSLELNTSVHGFALASLDPATSPAGGREAGA